MIDLSEKFNCISAHAEDKNVLILRKLDKPQKRFDGIKADYEVEHRWLSRPVINNKDEAWVYVLGADFSYWTKKELNELNAFEGNLLDKFNLF